MWPHGRSRLVSLFPNTCNTSRISQTTMPLLPASGPLRAACRAPGDHTGRKSTQPSNSGSKSPSKTV